jgi:hypothetical protein
MSSSQASPQDQATTMKDILDVLKTLQRNQTILASNVDAISGRVNVLSGMMEVQNVAIPTLPKAPVMNTELNLDDSHLENHDVPESPSLPATQVDSEGSPSQALSHARKTSVGGTSRIILT